MKNDTTYPYLEIDGSAIFESWEEVGNIAYDSEKCLVFTSPSVPDENCTIVYAYNP